MKLNIPAKATPVFTHEGGPAFLHLKPIQELRRSVLSCFLWENEFYENGEKIADRIERLAQEVGVQDLANLCVEARTQYNLRHVPLLLLCCLAKRGAKSSLVSETIYQTIQRADELTELCAVYWRKGKVPISAQMKKGLAKAFGKFNAYALGKYNRDGTVKLRDVLRLVHAKPNEEQQEVWKKLMDGTLESPDTWEVALSAGANKKETFTRLLMEEKLGYLALLRNLRNMMQSGVDVDLVKSAILARKGADRVLPFRFIAAARIVPQLEAALDVALQNNISTQEKLSGKTVILVDVSGSMNDKLSAKSDLTRMDAAAALASVINAENLRIFTFSHNLVEVPARRSMAGVDVIVRSQPHGGTYLGGALEALYKDVAFDRLIVITDEQSHDRVSEPACPHAYMINVASNQNGVGYGKWTHIDGFSERVISYITEHEKACQER